MGFTNNHVVYNGARDEIRGVSDSGAGECVWKMWVLGILKTPIGHNLGGGLEEPEEKSTAGFRVHICTVIS
jgi:hypothetical protein